MAVKSCLSWTPTTCSASPMAAASAGLMAPTCGGM
jgi:hypothetical protein